MVDVLAAARGILSPCPSCELARSERACPKPAGRALAEAVTPTDHAFHLLSSAPAGDASRDN